MGNWAGLGWDGLGRTDWEKKGRESVRSEAADPWSVFARGYTRAAMINLMYEHCRRAPGRIDAYCMFGREMHSDTDDNFSDTPKAPLVSW